MNPLVSIMMPAYNAERYINQAVESVLAQSFQDWELIIVDDGSTDLTASIATDYDDSRIKLIRQANRGESVARNTALKHMKGEYVAFLDADDLYFPDHLESTNSYLRQNPDLHGVYTDGYHCDQNGTILKSLSSRRRGPFDGWIFEQLIRASDVFGPPVCVVIRREPIIERQLDFDPRIVIGPDWDFFTRYAEFSNFGYIHKQTCLYRIHQENISVRTDIEERSRSLAICRQKAIKLASFSKCSSETRSYVFYDLLINLISDFPDRQNEITEWPEYLSLASDAKAKLYRLMASKAISRGKTHPLVTKWLQKSQALNPKDIRSMVLLSFLRISPKIIQYLLQIKNRSRIDQADVIPLGDLETSKQK